MTGIIASDPFSDEGERLFWRVALVARQAYSCVIFQGQVGASVNFDHREIMRFGIASFVQNSNGACELKKHFFLA